MNRSWWVAAGVSLVGVACGPAPEAPEGVEPGEPTYYGSLQFDAEIYTPILQQHIADAVDLVDTGDCFRFEALTRGDTSSVGMYDTDPSAIASVTRSDTFDFTVEEMEAAILADDWTEVYSSTFKAYEITSETDRQAYVDGSTHYYTRVYDATIEVAGTQISYPSNNQYRHIDNWDGTGHPLALLRGWLPSGAVSDSSSTTVSVIFKLELLIPIDGGARTQRLATTWSDLDMGLGEDEMFAIGCISLGNAMSDLQDWLEDQGA